MDLGKTPAASKFLVKKPSSPCPQEGVGANDREELGLSSSKRQGAKDKGKMPLRSVSSRDISHVLDNSQIVRRRVLSVRRIPVPEPTVDVNTHELQRHLSLAAMDQLSALSRPMESFRTQSVTHLDFEDRMEPVTKELAANGCTALAVQH